MPYPYFDRTQSAAYVYGSDPRKVLPLIAARFMGDNPEMPFILRTFDRTGIAANEGGQYLFDFGARFPDAPEGSYAYAVGDLYCPAAKGSNFTVGCEGPVKIWLGGECVFTSGGPMEGNPDQRVPFHTELRAGFNRFVIRCECTSIGFGCRLANAMPQWEPCNYVLPFASRRGEAGFAFTAPSENGGLAEDPAVWGEDEAACGVPFYPAPERERECFADKTGFYYIYTSLELSETATAEFRTAYPFWIDRAPGEQYKTLTRGAHEMLLRVPAGTDPTGAFEVYVPGDRASFDLPVSVKGEAGKYLLLGPFAEDALPAQEEIYDFTRPFGGAEGPVYWQSAYKNVVLRPYVESALYGRWTYPLGVTLYGLLRAGQWLGRPEYCEYVRAHVAQVVDIHGYALYDREKYGFPGVNQQAAWLDALDDCGSFGSLMLECGKSYPHPRARAVADKVAHYMRFEQPRVEDGAYKRRDESMWADDMYMSVPFLTRYALLSGDRGFFDEAANQLLLFKKHLFMEDKNLMSHMKSLRHGKKNEIPWCRGNGWVMFSLSELLAALPEDHEKRPALIAFYNDLVRGFLAVQDPCGLWHQILDDPESYLESSATAMFICAFSRGVVEGYMEPGLQDAAAESAQRAWKALTEYIIDRGGNIYGVCRGSSFSFSRHYYRSLSWNYNDTHGTGIIMLAGVELVKMQEYLK